MAFLYIVIIILSLALATLFFLAIKSRHSLTASEIKRNLAEVKVEEMEQELLKLRNSISSDLELKNTKITELTEKLIRSESRVESLTQQIARDKDELTKLQASFRLEFRNMANELMEEKSAQFKNTNKEALDAMLKPFRDNISDFRERVEKIYSEENHRIGALQNEIKNLMDLNHRITEETTNLTNALRGNSKVQGDWGEMILQTILESSNLINGIHYSVQENLKDESGNNLRPDVILKLPENKQIVIDSKVSLTAFVNYTSEAEDSRERNLKDHLTSFRKHVDELGNKKYQELINSPDFVVMFVPNEPAFICALQNDSTIWGDAYRKKVIVSSPTNLFALLKLVDDLWKRDTQSRNALDIANEGAKLYDKFVGFVESLESVGKGLVAAQLNYEKAMNQLKTGSGNLIGRTEKLRKLGLKTSKTLSAGLVSMSSEDDLEITKGNN